MVVAKQRDIPEISDTLGETLCALRLNGLIYASSELTAPWGIDMPAMKDKMMFHIVTQGSVWLRFPNHANAQLQPGDLALLPRGEGHLISSAETQPCEPFFDIPVVKLSERFELLRYGGGGDRTNITCGVLSFDHVAGEKLISQLPPVIHKKAVMANACSSLGR